VGPHAAGAQAAHRALGLLEGAGAAVGAAAGLLGRGGAEALLDHARQQRGGHVAKFGAALGQREARQAGALHRGRRQHQQRRQRGRLRRLRGRQRAACAARPQVATGAAPCPARRLRAACAGASAPPALPQHSLCAMQGPAQALPAGRLRLHVCCRAGGARGSSCRRGAASLAAHQLCARMPA